MDVDAWDATAVQLVELTPQIPAGAFGAHTLNRRLYALLPQPVGRQSAGPDPDGGLR